MTEKQKKTAKTGGWIIGMIATGFLSTLGTNWYNSFQERMNLPADMVELRDREDTRHLEIMSVIDKIVAGMEKKDEILKQLSSNDIELSLISKDHERRIERIERNRTAELVDNI